MSTKRTTETISLDGNDIIELLAKEYPGFTFANGKKFLLSKEFKLKLQKITLDPPKKVAKKDFDRDSWEPKLGENVRVRSWEPKVGDKVRVRSWEDMEKEFGLSNFGSIDCLFGFNKRMKKYCGEVYRITSAMDPLFESADGQYVFSKDMVEPV